MNTYVLENSIAMRWLLESTKPADQLYADSVLKSMVDSRALVPNLWHLEAANVLLGAVARKDVKVSDVERFTAQLDNLPIEVDPTTCVHAFTHTMTLASAYRLSSYDAAYLELALRENLPLATLDGTLLKAAKKAGVSIYLR